MEQRVLPERSQGTVGGNETILLVEDDEAVHQYVVSHLRSVGFVVLEAADGNAALKILQLGRTSSCRSQTPSCQEA